MSEVIEYLRSFSKEDHLILLREALGSDTLGDPLSRRLGASIDVAVPVDASIAMDYNSRP